MGLTRKIFIATCSWFCLTCNAQLLTNSSINSIFDSCEIKDLNTILTFFEKQICKQSSDTSISKTDCYSKYFQIIDNAFKSDSIAFFINYQEQSDFIKTLNKSTFSQIWYYPKLKTYNKITDAYELNDTLFVLDLKTNSKYSSFLNIVAQTDPIIEIYYNDLLQSGHWSPTLVSLILKNSMELDIQDIRIRLIIAIHYLTINDRLSLLSKISAHNSR